MFLNNLRTHVVLLISLSCFSLHAQRLKVNGGIQLYARIILGNQNQSLKIGAQGFVTASYGDISIESGTSIAGYQFFKRHTKKIRGLAYAYDFFALGGIGQNSNLLGSSISSVSGSIIFNPNGKGGFNGLGFGFSKDILPKDLKSYGLRRGMFLMRFSNANHSIHLAFLNDFKIGLFHGTGTDYGLTGSLHLGYTEIQDLESIYQLGLGIDLFTPRPNYSLSPRNPINSDDGRKNVWFTLPPYKELFYGNLYAFGTYQENQLAYHAKLGLNSQKAGAYIQNMLHDGLGLNPRFPWKVDQNDKLFIELSSSIFYKNAPDD